MKEKVVMIRVSILKRIGAFLIDFFIFLVLMGLAFGFIFGPIIDSTDRVKSIREDYYNAAMESGIYQGDNFSNLSYIDKDYDQKITLFYEKYDKIETYNKLKSGRFSDYFDYDETTNTFSEAKNEEAMTIAYQQILSSYCSKILYDNDTEFRKLSDNLSTFNLIEVLLSISLSGLICYIIFPLIFKNGQTIAKKIIRLQVVSLKGDYQCTWPKIVLRSLVFILFELLFVLFGGFTVIISLILAIFTKNNQSLHDLISSTTVIDLSYLPIEENTKRQIELEEIVESETSQQSEGEK